MPKFGPVNRSLLGPALELFFLALIYHHHHHHQHFCIAVCSSFLMVGIVGNFLSDVTTFYVLLMIAMTVPGAAIQFLIPRFAGNFSNFFNSSREGDVEKKEEAELFLPEINQEALDVLSMAAAFQSPEKLDDEDLNDPLLECISARTNDTIGSLNSKLSFYPDSSQMPSPEHSMDFMELDLNLGGSSQKSGFDSESNQDINLHLDENSSDEEEFARGLKLTGENSEKISLDDKNFEKTNLNSEALISMGQSLLSAVVQSVKGTKSEEESSSDTDSFELISEKDV